MSLVELRNVKKSFRLGGEQVEILHGIDLVVEKGEFVAMMGPSGSGKSTTMNILGCLDKPTSGQYFLDGRDVSELNRDELAAIRNSTIGFVFQGFNLLQRTSAVENVELPMLYAGVHAKERRERAKEALVRMGLGERLYHEPSQLSGGQQQRVAIARGIVNHAPILMADEPTGNLLQRTSAVENVELPMLYAGVHAKERRERAKEALVRMGLGERLYHEPSQLSGGQQQRVAIARGIVNHAPILMADEPTGNLDSKTSDEIMRLFQQLNREEGITIILVTHEPDVAAFAGRELLFRDGVILEDRPNEHRRT